MALAMRAPQTRRLLVLLGESSAAAASAAGVAYHVDAGAGLPSGGKAPEVGTFAKR